jgi:DNA-binding transcriptional ArsR family regulator
MAASRGFERAGLAPETACRRYRTRPHQHDLVVGCAALDGRVGREADVRCSLNELVCPIEVATVTTKMQVFTCTIDMQVNSCISGSIRGNRRRRMDDDKVFKALGDPGRRRLLDRLYDRNGQTLGQLCEDMGMSRQSVTQHLILLEEANLVSTVRRGREKLHFINPVPLHDIYERWVRKFEVQRLRLLHDLKRNLEGTEE